jgi:hypothetical protein
MNERVFTVGAVVFTVLIIVVAVLALGGQGSTAGNSTVQSSNSVLSAKEIAKEIGTVSMAKGIVPIAYEVINTGSEAVTINKLYTSCMCTRAQIRGKEGKVSGWGNMQGHGGGAINPNWTVASGETITVTAEFDPNAHGPEGVGPIQRVVVLETTSSKMPKVELGFSGTVVK